MIQGWFVNEKSLVNVCIRVSFRRQDHFFFFLFFSVWTSARFEVFASGEKCILTDNIARYYMWLSRDRILCSIHLFFFLLRQMLRSACSRIWKRIYVFPFFFLHSYFKRQTKIVVGCFLETSRRRIQNCDVDNNTRLRKGTRDIVQYLRLCE